MFIYEFNKNIPVTIKENGKQGYALYVKDSGFMQNDEWAIVLCDSGEIIHCLTNQFVIQSNFTFNINNKCLQKKKS